MSKAHPSVDAAARAKPRNRCKGCKRQATWGDLFLLKGLCVDCLPIAHTCSNAKPCEYDRLVSHTGTNGYERLASLRFCAEHIEAERAMGFTHTGRPVD